MKSTGDNGPETVNTVAGCVHSSEGLSATMEDCGVEHDDNDSDDDAREHVDDVNGDGGKDDDQENMMTLTVAMTTMLYMLSWRR